MRLIHVLCLEPWDYDHEKGNFFSVLSPRLISTLNRVEFEWRSKKYVLYEEGRVNYLENSEKLNKLLKDIEFLA
jgi:hypothetical protein